MKYIVKSVVCDYGVFEKTDNGEKLIEICNSLSNAELIADILNTDLKNERYEVVKKSKVDKTIDEIKELYTEWENTTDDARLESNPFGAVFNIIQRNIGE